MFPPGEPQVPGKLSTPDQRTAGCRGCGSLSLEYNPNKETGDQTEFHCDQPLTWPHPADTAAWPQSRLSHPVRIAPSNRCHLFCDQVTRGTLSPLLTLHTLLLQMLVSLLECKQGMWTGHPELGIWCNTMPPNASLISEEIIILHFKSFKQASKGLL